MSLFKRKKPPLSPDAQMQEFIFSHLLAEGTGMHHWLERKYMTVLDMKILRIQCGCGAVCDKQVAP